MLFRLANVNPGLSEFDLHEQTVQMLDFMKVQTAPQQPQLQPEPAPPEPQVPFMQQAASAQPRFNENRLSNYMPAQQPSGTPAIPIGPRGAPDLRALIDQHRQHGQ